MWPAHNWCARTPSGDLAPRRRANDFERDAGVICKHQAVTMHRLVAERFARSPLRRSRCTRHPAFGSLCCCLGCSRNDVPPIQQARCTARVRVEPVCIAAHDASDVQLPFGFDIIFASAECILAGLLPLAAYDMFADRPSVLPSEPCGCNINRMSIPMRRSQSTCALKV